MHITGVNLEAMAPWIGFAILAGYQVWQIVKAPSSPNPQTLKPPVSVAVDVHSPVSETEYEAAAETVRRYLTAKMISELQKLATK